MICRYYAKALLSAITEFQGTPDDVEEAVRARMARNRILNSPSRRFTMLIEESALRYRLGGNGVMTAQLGHLLSVTPPRPTSITSFDGRTS